MASGYGSGQVAVRISWLSVHVYIGSDAGRGEVKIRV